MHDSSELNLLQQQFLHLHEFCQKEIQHMKVYMKIKEYEYSYYDDNTTSTQCTHAYATFCLGHVKEAHSSILSISL